MLESENKCELMNTQDRLLLLAAREKDLPKTISSIIEEGADVEVRQSGWTPLMLSAWCGHLENVKILFKKGAGINSTNHDGSTAIMLAAQQGHFEIVELLKDWGADLYVRDKDGDTAESAARKMGHFNIVNLLS